MLDGCLQTVDITDFFKKCCKNIRTSFNRPETLEDKVLRAFYFFRIAHIMLVSIKKLEKHFIAPKARWCLHETGGALCATPACEVRGFTNEKF